MKSLVGKTNAFIISEIAYEGAYLKAVSDNSIEAFLPKEEVSSTLSVGDSLDAFTFLDQDNLTATLKKPIAQLGDFALLKVNTINRIGAFMDLGLEKELLVPFNEQKPKFELGRSYLVHLYLDKASQRLCGSSNLNKFISVESDGLKKNDEVQIIVAGRTDLGYKVIVNQKFWGIVFADQVFKPLLIGQTMTAYVAKVRDDNKLDIRLTKMGVSASSDLSDIILKKLEQDNGVIYLGDKSDPELIKKTFGCSKANFKRALGHLFKQGKVELSATKVTLIK